MITVIVPTMWKYEPFLEFANDILKLDVVSEMIIINNDPENTPDSKVLLNPKIKLVDFGKNIFVNQSWNYGVYKSTNDYICVMNDDIIFDLKIFYSILPHLTKETGCFCLSEKVPKDGKVEVSTGLISFEPHEEGVTDTYGYGVLFFIHKENWIDIPSSLIVNFGDQFIFDQCYFNGLQNYMIKNLFHYHAGAQTTKLFGNTYYNRDKENFTSVWKNLYDKRKI